MKSSLLYFFFARSAEGVDQATRAGGGAGRAVPAAGVYGRGRPGPSSLLAATQVLGTGARGGRSKEKGTHAL